MSSSPGPRSDRALLLMVKVPYPGLCKTRLCPPLSPAEAARLYRCFLVDLARELAGWEADVDLLVAWADEDRREGAASEALPEPLAAIFGEVPSIRQQGLTLTERMEATFARAFTLGYRQVVMRNSDSPHLPLSLLRDAFTALDRSPGGMVLGPDLDGGYYLVGVDAVPRGLFPATMSTGTVLEQTVAGAEAAGRPVTLLPSFLDVDTPDDLAAFWLEFGGRADVRHWATWRELHEHPALDLLGE